MSMEPNGIDRRKQRSLLPSQAIQFQLQQVAQRYTLEDVLLIDSEGELWAASRGDPDYVALFSSLPKEELQWDQLRSCTTEIDGKKLVIKHLNFGDTHLFLVAFGDPKRGLPGIIHAASGIERILGTIGKDPS